MKTINEALAWRSAVKEFDKENLLEDSVVEMLLEAARMAPTSYGLQPFKVILVKNPEVREKLKGASYNQAQVTDASHFVVFASKRDENEKDVKEYVETIAKVRSMAVSDLEQYEGMMNGALSHMDSSTKMAWAAKQAYLALGFLLFAASLSEVDAAPMEGFVAEEYDTILGLKEMGYTAAVVCALGKRASTDKYSTLPKVRKNKEDFIAIV